MLVLHILAKVIKPYASYTINVNKKEHFRYKPFDDLIHKSEIMKLSIKTFYFL